MRVSRRLATAARAAAGLVLGPLTAAGLVRLAPLTAAGLVLLAPLAVAGLVLVAPLAAAASELAGTWFVLAHYKDSATNNPDFERWIDKIWVIETNGAKLKWNEYPIVVFDDPSGRFERLGTNRQSRVLNWWEPNEGQLAEIYAGLEINPRGAKSKSMLGSDAEGWRSRGAISGFSANTLSYTETWTIEDVGGLPVFTIEESLGGARTESLDGVTEYRTTEVVSPSELRGRYNRDGTRIGTFRMIRAGGVSEVQGSGKDNNQRVMAMFASQMGGGEEMAALLSQGGSPKDVPEDVRKEVEAGVRKLIEDEMKEQGMDPRYFRPQVDDMTRQIMREWERGKTPEQIERMIRDGDIKPRPIGPMR